MNLLAGLLEHLGRHTALNVQDREIRRCKDVRERRATLKQGGLRVARKTTRKRGLLHGGTALGAVYCAIGLCMVVRKLRRSTCVSNFADASNYKGACLTTLTKEAGSLTKEAPRSMSAPANLSIRLAAIFARS